MPLLPFQSPSLPPSTVKAMDFFRNVAVSGDHHHHQQDQVLSTCSPCPSKLANPLDDLFPAHDTEVDVSLEWLSIFVEDCLSCSGICLPDSELPTNNAQNNAATTTPPPKPLQQKTPTTSMEKFSVPGKARSKRKRSSSLGSSIQRNSLTSWIHKTNINPDTQLFCSDPPMLQQAYWLADSELILPNKKMKANEDENAKEDNNKDEEEEEEEENEANGGQKKQQQQQPRRCSHCLSQRTPQWRAGPLGPKTLCNACGVRYKSGRLLPEYRPAKSPTFVNYLHSNSHKKVLEMRMSLMPPSSSLPK